MCREKQNGGHESSAGVTTYFASPERAKRKLLASEIDFVSQNPLMSGLLQSIAGLLAVLEEHRQILAVNDSFLHMLGIDNPEKALGLRPGEALRCIHAHEGPAGCGTTRFCSTCGAAIAIVASLGENKPVQRTCALTAKRGGTAVDMALLVRSQPITVGDHKLILLFLQDITEQQQRAALERTFFHDINNMLCSLLGASELLNMKQPSDLTKDILQSAYRLRQEVAIQRSLVQSNSSMYQPLWHTYGTGQIIQDIRSFFANHPAAKDKTLLMPEHYPAMTIKTDISLLLRIVCNMIINALEATAQGGIVRLWLSREQGLCIYVWNDAHIRRDIARRVFQRNFSTKDGAGRGIGTYSMKLFGEKILGGRVSFTTSAVDGTIFRFALPV